MVLPFSLLWLRSVYGLLKYGPSRTNEKSRTKMGAFLVRDFVS